MGKGPLSGEGYPRVQDRLPPQRPSGELPGVAESLLGPNCLYFPSSVTGCVVRPLELSTGGGRIDWKEPAGGWYYSCCC